MTWTLWTRQEIALIAAILTFACVAAFLSVTIDPPETIRDRSLERAMAVHQRLREPRRSASGSTA